MSLYTPSISPSQSGRSTPLGHFRDAVSALHQHANLNLGSLLDSALHTIQDVANNMLIAMSSQVHDAFRSFKSESDSEAHLVRYTSMSLRCLSDCVADFP